MSTAALLQDPKSGDHANPRQHAGGMRVSDPSDAHEHEAEHVADTVSRGGRIAGLTPGRWKLHSAQHKAPDKDNPVGAEAEEQKKREHAQAERIRKLKLIRGGKTLGHAPAEDAKRQEPVVHRKAESSGPVSTAPAGLVTGLGSAGNALAPPVRREMESKIGYDFGGVRVHTGDRAGDSAKSLSAKAYTVGNDIVFASGKYAPDTGEGKRLLAHELTHVVQQGSTAERAHPTIRPAGRQVQRSWWDDLVSEAKADARDWLIEKVRGFPGYDLISAVIARDLITGQPVPRDPVLILGKILELFPGGKEIFNKLNQTATVLKTAFNWLVGKFTEHHLTPSDLSNLLENVLAAVDLHDLSGSWNRVKDMLGEPMRNLIALAGEIGAKVLDFILEGVFTAFPAGKKIWPILQKAGATLSVVAADPLKFAGNLFKALKGGFTKFSNHLGENLLKGLQTFVFEEIDPKLKAPESYDAASLLKLGLEILGLTYERRRKQLVEKLEPLGGEIVVNYLEKAVDIIQKVRKGGFTAIWEMVKDKLSSIAGSIFTALKDWAISKFVQAGIEKVIALSNPAGEIIEVIRDIYEVIEFFIEKATKMIEFIESVVDSFAQIAEGDTEGAAGKIEGTIKRSIPLILRFLAGIFGLSGFGAAIRKVIDDIQKPIDEAIGKVLDFLVDKVTPIWNSVKASVLARLESVKQWWTKPKKFEWGEEEHELTLGGSGDHPEVTVHSFDPKSLDKFLDDVGATVLQRNKIHDLAKKLKWKDGEAQKPADDEKGAAVFDQLREEMAKLKAKDPPTATPEFHEINPKFGGAIQSETFISPRHSEGSPASAHDEDPAIWNDLGSLRDTKQLYFVRGHLVHSAFGGLGKWNNLMPITNGANQRMYHAVEKHLKKASAKGKSRRFYHYSVTAKYQNDDLPADDASLSTKANQKAREQVALNRLVKLSWTTTSAEADKTSKTGFKKTNEPLLDETGSAMPESVSAGSIDPRVVRE